MVKNQIDSVLSSFNPRSLKEEVQFTNENFLESAPFFGERDGFAF